MSLEFLNKSVQYGFKNEAKYGKNGKKRIYGHVVENAPADKLLQVGEALAGLQGDELGNTVLITKQTVNN